ncbi:hypothetical protein V2J09_021362 [Rumex salicifolius]
MEGALQSQSLDQNGRFQPPPPPSSQEPPSSRRRRPSSNFIGKHRLQASISLLELQIRGIETELQELEAADRPSAVCSGRPEFEKSKQDERSGGCKLGAVVRRSQWLPASQALDLNSMNNEIPLCCATVRRERRHGFSMFGLAVP